MPMTAKMVTRPPGQRLAVAAGDEVGDADDVLLLADADHLAQQKPPGEGDQGRAEVGGEKIEADGGGPPDVAVEGPGGEVDCQGEGIDPGVGDDAPPGGPFPVGIEGDREQQPEIEDGQGGNGHAGDRQGPAPLPNEMHGKAPGRNARLPLSSIAHSSLLRSPRHGRQIRNPPRITAVFSSTGQNKSPGRRWRPGLCAAVRWVSVQISGDSAYSVSSAARRTPSFCSYFRSRAKITGERVTRATRLGIAIRPLKASERFQTKFRGTVAPTKTRAA